MTTVYLAWTPSASTTLARHKADAPVDLLVSFVVLKQFEKMRKDFNLRSWCMDSGAFSVHNSGDRVDLNEYLAASKAVDANEIFALDVIGDPVASRVNYEKSWAAGVRAIPTFHSGSPWSELAWVCGRSEKIALGGVGQVGGEV